MSKSLGPKEIVDLLCELAGDEREAWFAQANLDPELRGTVEEVLADFDRLLEDGDR